MRKKTVFLLTAVLILLACLAGGYVAIGTYYTTHFFPHTTINSIDVSDLTEEEAEALIASEAENYRLVITERQDKQETITGDQIGYTFVSKGEVKGFLRKQNMLKWLPSFFSDGESYTMEASVTYEESLLESAVSALSCMQADQMTAPTDAAVQKQSDGTYAVTPETEGTTLDAGKVTEAVKTAVEAGKSTLNLELAGCYESPAVTSEDESLQKEADLRNRYAKMVITCDMGGDVTVTLDSSVFADWFSIDEDGNAVIDYDSVSAWVDQLADTYDTIGTYEDFVTSNDTTVSVQSVTYGWQMDREAETEALYSLLLAGESAEHTPVWSESAGTRGTNDIGDTYVEIDYTNQRMWYYKDGELLVETPVVTGNVSNGNASPEGIFCLVGKQEDATLVGEDYKTPVDYWMPFYGGVGIHDADSWRSTYGGDIYLTNGSHGCINTPTAQAAVIYQNIEIGTPIICYSSGIDYGYGTSSGGYTAGNATSSGSTGETSETGSQDIVIVGDTDETASSGDTSAETNTIIGSVPETSASQSETAVQSETAAQSDAAVQTETAAQSETAAQNEGSEDVVIVG